MSDILDLIDHAIADATSEDAMRWTPDAKRTLLTTSCGCAQCVWAAGTRAAVAALDEAVLGRTVQVDDAELPIPWFARRAIRPATTQPTDDATRRARVAYIAARLAEMVRDGENGEHP